MSSAKLGLDGNEYELPVTVGSEEEVGVDISAMRKQSRAITYDPGYGNTGSCKSAVTFIDGEKGILRYRGYPIEELAGRCRFTEVIYLLLYGELPRPEQYADFREKLTYHSLIHEDMKKFFEGYAITAHPMAILSSMVSVLSSYYPAEAEEDTMLDSIRLLAKAKTIAAFSYKKSIGQPFIYPNNSLSYTENFLRMMFAVPAEEYEVPQVLSDALNLLLVLHADHEQNCSTSTVRMVGSSEANLFASISAGINALWGPLHGGANQKVIEMLQRIKDDGSDYQKYVARSARSHRPAARDRQEPGRDRSRRRLLRRAQALSERRLLQRHHLPRHGHPHQHVHGDVRTRPAPRLDRPLARDARGSRRPHPPSAADLHRRHAARLRTDRRALGRLQPPRFSTAAEAQKSRVRAALRARRFRAHV
jgi:hypothetical protein